MLIKEYRICLPMTVEEYRIAQLYMIQKKSRNESSGEGSGVEILINEPYKDGPGGNGQYTHKLYHIGSHLPGWFRSMLPKTALVVEEEAWNAYPYTKTIYRTPFIEKFLLEIETVYHNDHGSQENVFNLTRSELNNRIVDFLDIVKDPISSGDYHIEEDPSKYISMKTGRGPLSTEWREEYAREINRNSSYVGSNESKKEIMCAYKLCKVEFKYWGMQTKTEKFIHDIALRKTMVRAHRQAWCWQDEYFGLTIDDIRRLEHETQKKLKEKMTSGVKVGQQQQEKKKQTQQEDKSLDVTPRDHASVSNKSSFLSIGSSRETTSPIEKLQHLSSDEEYYDADEGGDDYNNNGEEAQDITTFKRLPSIDDLDNNEVLFILLHGGDVSEASSQSMCAKNSDLHTLRRTFESVLRGKYPSMVDRVFVEMVACPAVGSESITYLSSFSNNNGGEGGLWNKTPSSLLSLFIVGSRSYKLLLNEVQTAVLRCFNKFKKQSFKRNSSHFTGQVCMLADSIGSLFLYDLLTQHTSHHSTTSASEMGRNTQKFAEHVSRNPSQSFNLPNYPARTPSQSSELKFPIYKQSHSVSNESSPATFRKNQNIKGGFSLHDPPPIPFEVEDVVIFGSSLPLLLAYRVHSGFYKACPPKPNCKHLYNAFYLTDSSAYRIEPLIDLRFCRIPPFQVARYNKFIDEVMFRIHLVDTINYHQPIFNKPTKASFAINDIDYEDDDDDDDDDDDHFKYSHSNNSEKIVNKESKDTAEHNYNDVFIRDDSDAEKNKNNNKNNDKINNNDDENNKSQENNENKNNTERSSMETCLSSVGRNFKVVNQMLSKWWGDSRIDVGLYSPEAFKNLPSHLLAPIVYSSFWESHDLVAFILRLALKQDVSMAIDSLSDSLTPSAYKTPRASICSVGKEKWLRKGTILKVKASAANHRGNDVMVLEGSAQNITFKFMYGALDVASLSGEKVDIDIMVRDQLERLDTVVTDAGGRVVYQIPEDKRLPVGLYPVRATVRVDQSQANLLMAVVPSRCEMVVFSIDGSFTASVSILGRDPRLQPGAVDVVRHWYNAGYLIHYISARPDMQYKKITKWLSKHNFPRGLLWFADGLSAEPLRQKAAHLRTTVRETQMTVVAAYGSSKDIAVYQSIGLHPASIFIVGKVPKKNIKEATLLSGGYTSHLLYLEKQRSQPANQKLTFRTGNFSTPPILQSFVLFPSTLLNQSWDKTSFNAINLSSTLANHHRPNDTLSHDLSFGADLSRKNNYF